MYVENSLVSFRAFRRLAEDQCTGRTPNLSIKTAWLKLSGKFSMGLGIPPLKIKIMFESNPVKPGILVRRLAVTRRGSTASQAFWEDVQEQRVSNMFQGLPWPGQASECWLLFSLLFHCFIYLFLTLVFLLARLQLFVIVCLFTFPLNADCVR